MRTCCKFCFAAIPSACVPPSTALSTSMKANITSIPSDLQAVILAGGLGSRLSEETHLRPKPMVEIGGKPILWHILKIYSHYGINDFIVCCGYKGYVIKEYFANYFLHNSDVLSVWLTAIWRFIEGRLNLGNNSY